MVWMKRWFIPTLSDTVCQEFLGKVQRYFAPCRFDGTWKHWNDSHLFTKKQFRATSHHWQSNHLVACMLLAWILYQDNVQFFQNSFVPWYSAPNKEAVQWRDKRGIFTSFAAFLLIVSIYPTRGIRMLYAQSLSFTCTSWVTVVRAREYLVFLPLYALKNISSELEPGYFALSMCWQA